MEELERVTEVNVLGGYWTPGPPIEPLSSVAATCSAVPSPAATLAWPLCLVVFHPLRACDGA